MVKDRKRKHKIGENGKPHRSALASKELVSQHPTFLSGTGRGTAECPLLKVSRTTANGCKWEADAKGRIRGNIQGEDYTAVLRWIGANGFTWHDAAGMLRVLGIPSRRNTIVSQVSAGSNAVKGETIRGSVPKLTPVQVAFVKSAIRRGKAEYEFDL